MMGNGKVFYCGAGTSTLGPWDVEKMLRKWTRAIESQRERQRDFQSGLQGDEGFFLVQQQGERILLFLFLGKVPLGLLGPSFSEPT